MHVCGSVHRKIAISSFPSLFSFEYSRIMAQSPRFFSLSTTSLTSLHLPRFLKLLCTQYYNPSTAHLLDNYELLKALGVFLRRLI